MLLWSPLVTWAQSNDFGTEYSLSWQRKVTDGGNLSLSESLRMADNSRRYSRSATEIGYDQSLLRSQLKPLGVKWSAGASYVFLNKDNFKGDYIKRHRMKVHTTASYTLGSWQLQYRLMYQYSHRIEKKTHKDHIRNRLRLRYHNKGSRWSFNLSEECFVRLNQRNAIDEWRTQLSTEYRLGKHNSIELNFRRSQEWQVKKPETLYLIGVGYNL